MGAGGGGSGRSVYAGTRYNNNNNILLLTFLFLNFLSKKFKQIRTISVKVKLIKKKQADFGMSSSMVTEGTF